MDLGLENRRVLVTGASGKIGRATAIEFGREGAHLALTFRERREDAEATAEEVERAGGKAEVAQLDLSDPSRMGASLAKAEDQLDGPVEVLVNNAVAWPQAPRGAGFEDVPLDVIRGSVEANLIGQYALAQAAVESMRSGSWGRIAHLSTGLVEDGFPGSAPYTVPKAGLYGLARTMSRELAGAGIFTNVVMAGFVPDESTPEPILEQGRRSAATGQLTRAEDVAKLIAFLCSEANGHITGETVRVDGHFLAALPA